MPIIEPLPIRSKGSEKRRNCTSASFVIPVRKAAGDAQSPSCALRHTVFALRDGQTLIKDRDDPIDLLPRHDERRRDMRDIPDAAQQVALGDEFVDSLGEYAVACAISPWSLYS